MRGREQEGDDSFIEVLPSLHAGAVAGVDGAVRRPLAVTAGADRAVRLWNHATRCGACRGVWKVENGSRLLR